MTTNVAPVGVVLGTAGHVDHGKSTLVRDLTGMEPDRLHEERTRGISIELGFVWCDLPRAGRVAFVDVPGHERFVRRMIAGAAGIDGVIFVVAADEGVMPQTREHLDICRLLGVSDGVVVLTKTDLVDEEWLELVMDDVGAALAGTFLEDAALVPCAHGDEAALEEVRAAIEQLALRSRDRRAAVAGRRQDRAFKMSVDRVFTMRGFGTVVTGTSQSGVVSLGDALELQPTGETARVRGLQVQGEETQSAGPGVRLAVNLQGLDRAAVRRGEVLATPGAVPVISMFDGRVQVRGHLREAPASGVRVLVHVGTTQVEGTLTWIGPPPVMPMESAFAQLRLDNPLPIMAGEPFVLRGFGAAPEHGRTIGGGVVLTPALRRHRQSDHERRAFLVALSTEGVSGQVSSLAMRRSEAGIGRGELPRCLALGRGEIREAVEALIGEGELILGADHLLHVCAATRIAERVQGILSELHHRRPAHLGMSAEEVRTRVRASLDPDLFAALLEWMERVGSIRTDKGVVALVDFTPHRSPEQQAACTAVLATLVGQGVTPPRLRDLAAATSLDPSATEEALLLLIQDGEVTRINQDLAYAANVLGELGQRLEEHLRAHQWIDTSQFKEITGASRKWSIPLMEYFDRSRLTVRVGDRRRLRSPGA